MNARETQIFNDLKGCKKLVCFTLREYPDSRDVGSDQFLFYFFQSNPGAKHSGETIRRSRQIVQNQLGIFPRNKSLQTWEKPVQKLIAEGLIDGDGQIKFNME